MSEAKRWFNKTLTLEKCGAEILEDEPNVDDPDDGGGETCPPPEETAP